MIEWRIDSEKYWDAKRDKIIRIAQTNGLKIKENINKFCFRKLRSIWWLATRIPFLKWLILRALKKIYLKV